MTTNMEYYLPMYLKDNRLDPILCAKRDFHAIKIAWKQEEAEKKTKPRKVKKESK